MSGPALFLVSVAVYAGVPLVLALWRSQVQFLLFYVHLTLLLTIGAILNAAYVLQLDVPVVGSTTIGAGQVPYGGFIFTTLVLIVVGRDLQVLRHVAALTVAVDLVVLVVFGLAFRSMTAGSVLNPLHVDPVVLSQSLRVLLGGGVLILLELLALIVVLERLKSRLSPMAMSAVYVVGFVVILLADGVLFPTLVLLPGGGLGGIIEAGLRTKLVLAATYAVPLLAFVALYRPALDRFAATPLHLRQLLTVSRDPLLAQLDETAGEARRANATVSRMLDAASTTILIATDPDMRITHFNRGAQKLLGFTEEEAVGQSPTLFLSEKEIVRQAEDLGIPRELRAWVEAQTSLSRHRDWEFTAKDGSTVMVSLGITEIRDQGRLVGYLSAGEDVTRRLRSEAVLTEALRREEASVLRLEQADRVKDELVSTISHELRTPITSIQGYTELLADGLLGDMQPAQSEALAKVSRNVSRLETLVDDLLFVAKAEAGELAPALTSVDVRAVVAGTRDTLDQLRRERDVEVGMHLPDGPVTLIGDAGALERVVLNLAGNAIKFTPDGGRVDVRLAREADGCRLTVSDTGVGIAEEDRPRLFTRFFRTAEANNRAIPGSGLGLSVVQGIVAQHGGTIAVDSELGRGTTFTVRLRTTGATDAVVATT